MQKVEVPKRQQPVSVWREKEIVQGEAVDTLVAVLRGKGCFWASTSGCLMCGYSCDTISSVTELDLLAQFDSVLALHEGEKFLKIYTSGSFFDNNEISPEVRKSMLDKIGDKFDGLLVESRPEFINTEVIETTWANLDYLEVAIGLESASDDVRARCINKGFGFEDYEKASRILRDLDVHVRTYLLLKPPFLTERRAIADAVESAELADDHTHTISFNPVNVQRDTVVERLWRRGSYRPPWLWSLIDVIQKAERSAQARIISSPSGGGSRRGVHNCGKCDNSILNAISSFSMSGDPQVFDNLDCGCKDIWLDSLDLQELTGTTGDIERLSLP